MTTEIRIEPADRRVRATIAGRYVVDTTSPLRVWEHPHYPAYYVPEGDVAPELLDDPERVRRHEHPDLEGYVKVRWDSVDHWFEEDEEVFVHPRDPYSRIDILRSSRHVQVEIDGVTVADSNHPMMLQETGLPTRWYFPKTDVRLDLLEPTDKVTHCPYKGQAQYWSARIGDVTHPDIAWSYRVPIRESAPIEGLIAFYDERVDLIVDGVRRDRPVTPFSPQGSPATT
jgi:uncharacterized protein (DUF427 family)